MNNIYLENGQTLMFWHTDILDAVEETLRLTGLNMFLAEKAPQSERGYRAYNFATTIASYQDYINDKIEIDVFEVKNGQLFSMLRTHENLLTG